MRLALEELRALAAPRLGDVLAALGARVRGSAERGRATAPDRETGDLNLSYGNGYITDHVTGETTDALGMVARVRGLDPHRAEDLREAAADLAALLGERLNEDGCGRGERHHAPRRATAAEYPVRDAAPLWEALACRDEAGERYLAGRSLLREGRPIADLVRFNVGASRDHWLDSRAAEGFRVAFPVRTPDGNVQSLSLRYIGKGAPPEAYCKAPSLAGCSTSGAAVCRPEIGLLANADSGFLHDEVVIVEGGPDAVAATLIYDPAAIEGDVPPTWALGVIGVSAVASVIEVFRGVVRGRVVHVALDSDAPGEAAVSAAAEAAYRAGASRVTRIRPPGKDLAEAWEARHVA